MAPRSRLQLDITKNVPAIDVQVDEARDVEVEREAEQLRSLDRSPHPYQLNFEDDIEVQAHQEKQRLDKSSPKRHDDSALASSESGTEADDETERQHFIRALPAPLIRPRKGLKAGEKDEDALLTPSQLDDEGRPLNRQGVSAQLESYSIAEEQEVLLKRRLHEFARRCSEIGLLGLVIILVFTGRGVWPVVRYWQLELLAHVTIMVSLVLAYPVKLSMIDTRTTIARPWQRFRVPASFDPATVLYPPILPVLVALSVSSINRAIVLPNIMLGLASLPQRLFPRSTRLGNFNTLHWVVSILPLMLGHDLKWTQSIDSTHYLALSNETLVSLYPLHHALLQPLHYLTTKSLLISELHLLSTAMINLLLFASAPQAVILKACLWIGGSMLFVCAAPILHWNVVLARVPKWKLRRPGQQHKARISMIDMVAEVINVQRATRALRAGEESDADEDEDPGLPTTKTTSRATSEKIGSILEVDFSKASLFQEMHSRGRNITEQDTFMSDDNHVNGYPRAAKKPRRFTLPTSRATTVLRPTQCVKSKKFRRYTTVPWYLQLTADQASRRKNIYAAYIYMVIVATILIPVRRYIGIKALAKAEPVGWAISYLFGQLEPVRDLVTFLGIDFWIPLPQPAFQTAEIRLPLSLPLDVAGLREDVGAANVRLLLIAYWVSVLATGLIAVFTLTPYVEVDTRRKIFHGVMVGMFLPATFIEPCYCSLALGLVLSIFLLLEVIRAGQVYPLGTAIGRFISPYVDGRDLRGPVVVSHFFLAIGCAIPLWFSLAALGRQSDGHGVWKDWETTDSVRGVDMISGVVCVGMGDAAASLFGRRYGRRKWAWIGGKSLEGSAAFALFVTLGLLAGKIWLWLGGWQDIEPIQHGILGWAFWLVKATLCACGASFMEAVLTGANDNVVVPVVLWLLVKGMRL